MVQWKLYLFGPPRIERNGQPLTINLRKALALLVYLAVTRQSHSRDALATLFWPDKDQQGARANLRRTLYDLSQLLGGELLTVGPEVITLHADETLWMDVSHFQTYLATHLALADTQQPATAEMLAALALAVDLYTDHFLAGFTLPDCPAFDDWQFFQREELRDAYAHLLQAMVNAHVVQGRFEEALRFARRWLLLDPLEEAVHRRLMRLYAQAGQLAAALRQYDECVRILAEELEVPPDEETVTLYEAIRAKCFPPLDKVTSRQDFAPGGRPRAGNPLGANDEGVTSEKVTSDRVTRPQGEKVNETPITQSSNLSFPPSPSHPATPLPHNLPTQTTPFIGRVQELGEVLHRLCDPVCRLLTLIGPGGIGKTRLALEAAQRIVDHEWATATSQTAAPANPQSVISKLPCKDGVFFVALHPVTTVSGLITAIAEATGFRFYSAVPPQQQLVNFLRTKQMLLVLDNFEHLLAGISLITDLLAAAPELKLLVTSREALNLQEEWFHPLAGLMLPPVASRGDQRIADAVQLFVQSARRARPAFSLATEQEPVARICRLVDGAPLALELAAAWVKVLSCERIAEEIAHNLDILTTRHQNIPSRHRSMRAVLEQTWQLLLPDEQRTILSLSVFESGFTQDAAREVAGASLLTLATLTEKALVRVGQAAAGQNRYQMHELLRQFVAEQLAALPEEKGVTRARHGRYYLQLLEHRAPHLSGKEQQTALHAISIEIDNVRTAWQWAVEQRAVASLQAVVDPLYNFYQIRSRYLEGKDLFVQAAHAMQVATVADDALALLCLRLRARCGAFCHFLCEYEAAESHLQACLVSVSALDQPVERAFVLNFLGQLAMWRGEKALAKQHLTQSLAISRTLGDKAGEASALEKLANLVDATLGEYAASKELAMQTLHRSRELGRPDWIAYALDTLGFVTFALGEYADSELFYRESLQLFESIDDQYGIAMALGGLGLLYWAIGGEKLAEAHDYLQRSLVICRAIGHQGQVAGRLAGLARIANDQGHYQQAQALAQAGLVIARELGSPVYLAHLVSCLGETAYRSADLMTARAYLLEALQLTAANELFAHLAIALFHYATLLLAESETNLASASSKRAQAMELLTLVHTHPATWQMYKVRAAQRIAAMPPLATPPQRPTATMVEVAAALLAPVPATS